MNKRESDVLKIFLQESYVNQRMVSELTGHSLGAVNRAIKKLMEYGFLSPEYKLTEKAHHEIQRRAPKNAIILAAGFGMRMVPVNLTASKAFIEVKGEILIERTIRQLQEAGIRDITIVVGFMKESFEYLIDKYGVELVVNQEYAAKNNLISLSLAADRISNTYIIPCDIWCRYNPYSNFEMYSWYMVSDRLVRESDVRVNRKMELAKVSRHADGNAMIGIAYLLGQDAETVKKRIKEAAASGKSDTEFWEAVLYKGGKMMLPARIAGAEDVVEINTYEELRELDRDSNHLKSEAIDVTASVFHIKAEDINNITVLKKGMTNRSFLFSIRGEKYIMRIPGEGTERLIKREQEAEVFKAIRGRGLCDDPVYINPSNGYKITRFLEGSRTCIPDQEQDLDRCMKVLRDFHAMKIQVDHTFDLFGQIEFYEKLWEGQQSIYRDYKQTKKHVFELKKFIDSLDKDWCLTHIDAVPDNFLIYTPRGEKKEMIQLTDWEYAGMQDPHVDIAMFCIYSMYSRNQVDNLIDLYFQNRCERVTRTKIYAYISICGLLWSNWCEYKRSLGVEFGEYSLRQYRFAKEYYQFAAKMIEGCSAEA